MSVQPITPEQAKDAEGETIPAVVIEAVNALIQKNVRYGRAVLLQKDVIDEILTRSANDPNSASTIKRDHLFKNKWLDFEAVFRRAGWDVSYDSPGYNESYEPNWTFTAKR